MDTPLLIPDNDISVSGAVSPNNRATDVRSNSTVPLRSLPNGGSLTVELFVNRGNPAVVGYVIPSAMNSRGVKVEVQRQPNGPFEDVTQVLFQTYPETCDRADVFAQLAIHLKMRHISLFLTQAYQRISKPVV